MTAIPDKIELNSRAIVGPDVDAATYIAMLTHDLAELARDHKFDLLSYLLEMAAIEASKTYPSSASANSGEARSNVASSRQPVRRSFTSALKNQQIAMFAMGGQRLQRIADVAEEAVAKRRATLRELTKAERLISRRQSENRRILDRLVKKVA